MKCISTVLGLIAYIGRTTYISKFHINIHVDINTFGTKTVWLFCHKYRIKLSLKERIIKYKSSDLYVHVLEINVVLSRDDDNGDQTVSYYGSVNIFCIYLHMLPLI